MRFKSIAVAALAGAFAFATAAPSAAGKIEGWSKAVDWVLAQGKNKTLDAGAAEALGLPPGLPIRQKGFQTDDQMKHFLQVSTASARADVLIVLQDPSSAKPAYFWLTDRGGELRKTAKNAAPGSVVVVPNKEAAAAFEAEKKYWLGKAPK